MLSATVLSFVYRSSLHMCVHQAHAYSPKSTKVNRILVDGKYQINCYFRKQIENHAKGD
ncbi:MAG: hypothetical protein ACOVMQ_01235 [Cyclobacteriaceae bacterium]